MSKLALARQLWNSRAVWRNPLSTATFVLRSRGGRNRRVAGNFAFDGLPFAARLSDWCAVEEVALRGEYEPVRPILAPLERPVVVDLGANIGMFSLYVLRHAPDAVVHSYEPGADTFAVLERNQKQNPRCEWRVTRAAAWSSDGQVTFEDREFSTSSRITTAAQANTVSVPALSLDSIFKATGATAIDLMKVDIEGAEEAVLCARPELLDRVGSLLVEIHPQLCEEHRIVDVLTKAFPFLYEIPDRESSKPLLLAARQACDLPALGSDGVSSPKGKQAA